MQTIDYVDLTEAQQEEIAALENDTLPQGQDFFLEGEKVLVVECNLRELFEGQNVEEISKELILEIIF